MHWIGNTNLTFLTFLYKHHAVKESIEKEVKFVLQCNFYSIALFTHYVLEYVLLHYREVLLGILDKNSYFHRVQY